MTDESTGFATPTALDDLLHDAKLSVPRPRPGTVSRANLIGTARASDCRVVGISAPAGYGKTTLLAEWAAAEDRRVAWVSLERADDDPGRLLTVLASAYSRVTPGCTDLVADMGGLGLSALGRAAPRLATALRTSPTPFVLMLDDLHELGSADCHDALSVVIGGIPAGSQFVAASRSEQPHLPRLRASGNSLEFQAVDLALDAGGAEQIFSMANVGLTRDAAVDVTRRTEGWPVGLYLAALIAKDNSRQGLISGQDRFVADYLYSEALRPLSEDQLRFLRRTAVLEHLSAPLCDAVVGEPGAQDQLRHLEASNLFLVPLDRRREWYRYHGLFREFLLGELGRVEPDIIVKLHLRAADWYQSSGSPGMAVEHLLHTTEVDRCARLVAELVLPTFEAGQISTVERWLTALGDRAIEAYPPLAVLAGWITLYSGRTVDGLKWAAYADAATFDLVQLDGSASFESARAMLRSVMCPDGPLQMLADSRLAVAQEPAWSPWRDTALCLLAEALLLNGDADQAAVVFAEASATALAVGNADPRVVSESELALLAIDGGDWKAAEEHTEIALAAIEERRMYDYPTCTLAFAAATRIALHQGDQTAARRHIAAAMRVRPLLTIAMPFFAVRVRLHLAKAHCAISEDTTARHLLREIDDILVHRPALGTLVDDVDALRRIVMSSDRAMLGASPLTPAELRLLPYLQTHLTIGDIADRLFVSRNTVNTQISSIYRKLGVSSRNEAVDHATTAGLLGG